MATIRAGERCECGHGAVQHVPNCTACACVGYIRSRGPAGTLPTDGQHDGSWRKGAEGGGSLIVGHAFVNLARSWDRCGFMVDGRRCGMSEAAHRMSFTPYVPDAPRAA